MLMFLNLEAPEGEEQVSKFAVFFREEFATFKLSCFDVAFIETLI
jgi:hypothetical protein